MPMPESWCKRSAKAQAVGRESAVGREGAKFRKLRISHPEHLSFASEADEQEERGCGNCRKGLFRTFFLSEQNL